MSTSDPVRRRPTVGQYDSGARDRHRHEDPDRVYGWVLFAGSMLLMLATLNGLDGIAAVSNSKFFTANATYVFSDLNTYGWVLIVMSVVQGLAALGIMGQIQGARWVGVGIAALNGVAQLLFIPAYPLWSLTLFAVDILVIYGLVAHGGRSSER